LRIFSPLCKYLYHTNAVQSKETSTVDLERLIFFAFGGGEHGCWKPKISKESKMDFMLPEDEA
jgi:hypothetical protein